MEHSNNSFDTIHGQTKQGKRWRDGIETTGEMSTGTTRHKTGNNGVFMLRPSFSSGSTTAEMMMLIMTLDIH